MASSKRMVRPIAAGAVDKLAAFWGDDEAQIDDIRLKLECLVNIAIKEKEAEDDRKN